jgi:hypothetical protein
MKYDRHGYKARERILIVGDKKDKGDVILDIQQIIESATFG